MIAPDPKPENDWHMQNSSNWQQYHLLTGAL
jgi:hypothetical protein